MIMHRVSAQVQRGAPTTGGHKLGVEQGKGRYKDTKKQIVQGEIVYFTMPMSSHKWLGCKNFSLKKYQDIHT